MKKFFKENRKGFTLIELLVVIAILAVLATLYVPKIISSTADAKATVDFANARTVASEITLYNAYRDSNAGTTSEVQIKGVKLEESSTNAAVAAVTALSGCTVIPQGWEGYINATSGVAETTSTGTNTGIMTGRGKIASTDYFILIDSTGSAFVVKKDGTYTK